VAWEGDSREPTLLPPHSRISNNEALKTIENLTLPNSLSKLYARSFDEWHEATLTRYGIAGCVQTAACRPFAASGSLLS
jgi:hypothetical protein